MDFTPKLWSKLHTMNAVALCDRWLANPDREILKHEEALLDSDRFDKSTLVWTVKSEIELIRLLGALQWHNPKMALWYRGETKYWGEALPLRIRDPSRAALTKEGIAWLNSVANRDRALRDRNALARAAILQHYGCPTSLLDVSSSYEIACAFAFENGDTGKAHLRVYALPRHQQAITVFDDADIVLVDLKAELPSYCARPHAQQAAFLARRAAVYNDIEDNKSPVDKLLATVDDLRIAHIHLNFEGAARFYNPRQSTRTLYPEAGKGCFACERPADMNGDYLRHILDCYEDKGKPEGFPDKRGSPDFTPR